MDDSSQRDQGTPIVVTQLKMIQAPAEAIKEGIKGAAEAITPGQ